ncbi:hypothetical protein PQX77_007049 [Marasmius sp. AFHP31]|nr:hypothetical protein PQX77_007049 [Marasmius sp. AFHP31]
MRTDSDLPLIFQLLDVKEFDISGENPSILLFGITELLMFLSGWYNYLRSRQGPINEA